MQRCLRYRKPVAVEQEEVLVAVVGVLGIDGLGAVGAVSVGGDVCFVRERCCQ